MLYSLSDEAIRLIILMAILHNSFNAILCPAAFSLSNGLRAAGDVRYTMYASIFATVVCRVALSVLFGIVLNMGVIGIVIAMVGDWAIKASLILVRYRREKWKTFKVI